MNDHTLTKLSLYSGESRASSRANYVITHEKLCWSISFQNVYHNKRKVIKKLTFDEGMAYVVVKWRENVYEFSWEMIELCDMCLLYLLSLLLS